MAGGAPLTTWRGAAATFHARPLPTPVRREVWWFEVEQPALVLGSGQAAATVDEAAARAAGVGVVRRRSGGGAVLLEPGAVVWFDVVVPAAELRAAGVGDDVAASMVWLGGHVVSALRALGVHDVGVHAGAMRATPWSRTVCFAGLGPGEIVRGDAKLVGISQRRSRDGARYQCAVHVAWAPARLLALLSPPVPTADELPPVAVLPAPVATALPAAVAAALGGVGAGS